MTDHAHGDDCSDGIALIPSEPDPPEVERIVYDGNMLRSLDKAVTKPCPPRPDYKPLDKGMVHLHLHTEHSFLDGLPKTTQLMQRVAELGQEAVAITDHGEVSGHYRMQKAGYITGIKPILGCEGYFCDDRTEKVGRKGAEYQHMTVLAKNNTGLHNLWAALSEAFITGSHYGDPRFDWEIFERYGEGLIATGGCLSGNVARFLKPGPTYNPDLAIERISRFQEIFGDDFYLELHTFYGEDQFAVNRELVRLGEEFSVPLLAVSDSHYLRPEDWQDHEFMTALSMRKTISDPTRYQYGPDQLHVYPEQEVRDRLAYLDEEFWPGVVDQAIANTVLVANQCDAHIEGVRSMPVFFGSAEMDKTKMTEMAEEGFRTKVEGKVPPERMSEYRQRLDKELSVIVPKGFPGYFLMTADLVRQCKDKGWLVGPGRGSAGGCMVAWLLGITEVDPVRADLIFERFLDPERASLPDIDIDFPQLERPLVKQLLVDQYGERNVAVIGTLDTLAPKRLIRDLARGLEIPESDVAEINQIIGQTPDLEVAHIETGWAEINEAVGDQLQPWKDKSPVHARMFDMATRFLDHIRHAGAHASGMVVSKEDLMGRLPLRFKSDEIRTMMDYRDVEDLGFVKVDILGLRTLSTLMRARTIANERLAPDEQVPDYNDWQFDWDRYYEDGEVYRGLWAGKNIGVFQLESAGLRNLVKEFKPESLEDMCAILAVFRPGITRTEDLATGMNLLDLYVAKRNGSMPETYKHDALREVLSNTHGQFLYQEQIMKACVVLAGYDLKDTDRVRKILGKKIVSEMIKERQIFVDGCVKNGVEEDLANSIFDDMEQFGKYGFNRSHAYAYAMVAQWCAWMKHYHPREFMTALFQTNEDDAAVYARECRRLGIPLLHADINESGRDFTLTEAGVIRYGLSKIKYLGRGAAIIVAEREENGPYLSVADFVERVPRGKVNKAGGKAAACSGALDSLVSVEEQARFPGWDLSTIALYLYYEARGGKDAKDLDLEHSSGGVSNFEEEAHRLNIADRAKMEKTYLGSVVSIDPLGPYMDLIEHEETFRGMDDLFAGEYGRMAGIITGVRPTVTKRGKNPGAEMCQMWIDVPPRPEWDRDDNIQVVVFPDSYGKYKTDLQQGVPVLIDVKKLSDGVCLDRLFRLDKL